MKKWRKNLKAFAYSVRTSPLLVEWWQFIWLVFIGMLMGVLLMELVALLFTGSGDVKAIICQ